MKVSNQHIVQQAVDLLESGEDTTGVCHNCGEIQDGVEPDAEKYECENCGVKAVYGAEQTLIMLA